MDASNLQGIFPCELYLDRRNKELAELKGREKVQYDNGEHGPSEDTSVFFTARLPEDIITAVTVANQRDFSFQAEWDYPGELLSTINPCMQIRFFDRLETREKGYTAAIHLGLDWPEWWNDQRKEWILHVIHPYSEYLWRDKTLIIHNQYWAERERDRSSLIEQFNWVRNHNHGANTVANGALHTGGSGSQQIPGTGLPQIREFPTGAGA